MVALKNKEKEMVKILLKNPRVDRGDLMKTKEGNDILTEMIQEADQENRKLPSKVPDCPVSIYCFVIPQSDCSLFPGLSHSVLPRLPHLPVL